jgi:hypothetical protein
MLRSTRGARDRAIHSHGDFQNDNAANVRFARFARVDRRDIADVLRRHSAAAAAVHSSARR